MTSFNFNESQYRFTSPIRYFKSNDPIYYEVENIPLKQLHENDLWLKDQLFNIKLNSEVGVDRSLFNELKPYATDDDNVVRVLPGRFTARINDAYDLTPLQIIRNVLGDQNKKELNVWLAKSAKDTDLATILNAFKNTVSVQAINLNGLIERAFSWPATKPNRASDKLNNEEPKRVYIGGDGGRSGQPPYPGIGGSLYANFYDPNSGRPSEIPEDRGVDNLNYDYILRQYDTESTIGFARLGAAETAFIKKWRGVARTAVVDVPQELSIEIPQFNSGDHFYINELGNKVLLPATQRIDLLFIYSKPVDSGSTTIAKFQNGAPTTITSPQLGIVYGAGLGVNFKELGTNKSVEVLSPANVDKIGYTNSIDSTLPDGTIKMLSHFGDETAANTGFTISGVPVKGSFPSPDDLMNLSPLLDEELDASSLALVGQSVLPVAYIIVKQGANLNSQGNIIIGNSDIIDIRPFFRTTELSYNERAGIAAAIPSPSLANPIVTQAELKYELKQVYDSLEAASQGTQTPGGGPANIEVINTIPRVVARGVVCGGLNFGVESVLGSIILEENSNLSQNEVLEIIKNEYGYAGVAIPALPAWDKAKWCEIQGGLTEKGLYSERSLSDRLANELLDAMQNRGSAVLDNGSLPRYKYAAYSNKEKTARLKRFGTQTMNNQFPGGNNISDGVVTIYFVKKTIKLNMEAVRSWMGDYDVNVQYLNCFPLTMNSLSNDWGNATDEARPQGGKAAGLWVEKLPDRFTIYAAWAAVDPMNNIPATGNAYTSPLIPPLNRSGNHFAGFGVFNNKLFTKPSPNTNALIASYNGEADIGIAIYPTIQFQVIGIPTSFAGNNVGLDLTDPDNQLVLA